MTRGRVPVASVEDVLVRSRRRCALCYVAGDADLKEGNVAHIITHADGGLSSPDNLVYLCPQHHAAFDHARGRGVISPEVVVDARDRLYREIEMPLSTPSSSRPRVFVFHGRHERTTARLLSFLHEIGIAPVVLSDQPSLGRTFLEVLEDASDVRYAIALLTPDEVGSPAHKMVVRRPRTRQNVIFELGYFIGRLGINRVCALYHPDVELPSDSHGTLYIQMDASDRWKESLLRQLNSAGVSGLNTV